MEVVATRDGNTFNIEIIGAETEGAWLMLNPEMIDVNAEVIVKVDEEEFYRGKPKPSLPWILKSLDAKLDKRMYFDRAIPLWKPE